MTKRRVLAVAYLVVAAAAAASAEPVGLALGGGSALAAAWLLGVPSRPAWLRRSRLGDRT